MTTTDLKPTSADPWGRVHEDLKRLATTTEIEKVESIAEEWLRLPPHDETFDAAAVENLMILCVYVIATAHLERKAEAPEPAKEPDRRKPLTDNSLWEAKRELDRTKRSLNSCAEALFRLTGGDDYDF